MSAHSQGQAKEYKDEICGKHWGVEGAVNISSISGEGAACANGTPLRTLLSASLQRALGFVGLVYQEGSVHNLKGWVAIESELF